MKFGSAGKSNAAQKLQGTTTNGEYLLPFKTGAFLAGEPVQPVILKYGQVLTASYPSAAMAR